MILTVSDLAGSLSPAEAAQRVDNDSSTEESEPGPAPERKREKQQEVSMLMATDEEEQTEGSFLEINTQVVQDVQDVQSPCCLFRHIQNQHRFAVNRRLTWCVRL